MESDTVNNQGPRSLDPLTLKAYIDFLKEGAVQNRDHTIDSVPRDTITISNSEYRVRDIKPYFSQAIQPLSLTQGISQTLGITSTPLSINDEDLILNFIYTAHDHLDNFEFEAAVKFKKFGEVTDIYIKESKQLITIRVFLKLDKYDYDLMSDIFNKAEFPLKDEFEHEKLIDVQYIYSTEMTEKKSVDYFGKRLYHKVEDGK